VSDESNQPSSAVLLAEEQVKAQSQVLGKPLGVSDLVFTQILFIVGFSWVGIAAKLGPSQCVYWLLAVLLFYVPSAVVVIYLAKLMPIEGGLYQWAKFSFNDFTGFFVAWNLWLFTLVITSEIGLVASTNLSYALGERADWMAGNKGFISLTALLILASLAVVSIRGLGLGKWIHNVGGFILVAVFGALIFLPFIQPSHTSAIRAYHSLALTMPPVSLFSLNILGKMGFGALGGIEYIAILAGESRSPERSIGRSVAIGAPIIALMFILGTAGVLSFVGPEDVDLIGPIPQVLSLGTRSFGIGAQVVPIVILLLLGSRVAQASVNFTGSSRMPLVAGWDHLLPAWFTRLHPRFHTPVNSILFAAAMMIALAVVVIVGVGQQEAYQLLENCSAGFYSLTYLVMFAIPLIGWKKIATHPPPLPLRIAALSGFLMTLLFIVFSMIPVVPVASKFLFTAKILGMMIGATAIGALIYKTATLRTSRANERTAP
jgi:amino acid transporter